jgi:hypothetical protein
MKKDQNLSQLGVNAIIPMALRFMERAFPALIGCLDTHFNVLREILE